MKALTYHADGDADVLSCGHAAGKIVVIPEPTDPSVPHRNDGDPV